MNTLHNPINEPVPGKDKMPSRDDIQNSGSPSTWFCLVALLLLSISAFYLLWAKVFGAWPFSP